MVKHVILWKLKELDENEKEQVKAGRKVLRVLQVKFRDLWKFMYIRTVLQALMRMLCSTRRSPTRRHLRDMPLTRHMWLLQTAG
jgi:hypothetical protein